MKKSVIDTKCSIVPPQSIGQREKYSNCVGCCFGGRSLDCSGSLELLDTARAGERKHDFMTLALQARAA